MQYKPAEYAISNWVIAVRLRIVFPPAPSSVFSRQIEACSQASGNEVKLLIASDI